MTIQPVVAPYTCGVLTVSDKGAAGLREDTSGPALQERLSLAGFTVHEYAIVPDEEKDIAATICHWIDATGIDLVITTGGTGLSPRDVTPEATRSVLKKEIPGIAEAMRAASLLKTPHAMLSRGIAGIRGKSLVINLPGSKRAALENIDAVLAALPHALEKIQGGAGDCGGSSVVRNEIRPCNFLTGQR